MKNLILEFVDKIIERQLRTWKPVLNWQYKLLCSRKFFYNLLEELLNTEEMTNKVSWVSAWAIALQYKNIDIVIDDNKNSLFDYEFVLKTVCDEVWCDEDEEEWWNYNYNLNEVEPCENCCIRKTTEKQYFIDNIRYYMNRYKKLDWKVWLETFKEDTKDFYLFFEGDDWNEWIQVCEYYDI
jgi:hypothetical protein